MFRINSTSPLPQKLLKKIHKINLSSHSRSQSKRRCEERIIENFSAGALDRQIHGAIRVRGVYRGKKEREGERISSWESYISPTTSVGINPGQFILLNLFRLAQIVTVSRLQIKLPRKAVSQPSFQVRMLFGVGRELSPSEDR